MVLHPSKHVILFERFLPSDFIVRSTLKIHYNFSTIILLNDHNRLNSNQKKKKKKFQAFVLCLCQNFGSFFISPCISIELVKCLLFSIKDKHYVVNDGKLIENLWNIFLEHRRTFDQKWYKKSVERNSITFLLGLCQWIEFTVFV